MLSRWIAYVALIPAKRKVAKFGKLNTVVCSGKYVVGPWRNVVPTFLEIMIRSRGRIVVQWIGRDRNVAMRGPLKVMRLVQEVIWLARWI